MKKSFRDRIKAMELRLENRQINEPVTFFDEEHGVTMQIIGNGLIVPLPMSESEWVAMVEKNQASISQKHSRS